MSPEAYWYPNFYSHLKIVIPILVTYGFCWQLFLIGSIHWMSLQPFLTNWYTSTLVTTVLFVKLSILTVNIIYLNIITFSKCIMCSNKREGQENPFHQLQWSFVAELSDHGTTVYSKRSNNCSSTYQENLVEVNTPITKYSVSYFRDKRYYLLFSSLKRAYLSEHTGNDAPHLRRFEI